MTDNEWFDQFDMAELRRGARFHEPMLKPMSYATIARMHLIANELEPTANYDCPHGVNPEAYAREYRWERFDALTCGLRRQIP